MPKSTNKIKLLKLIFIFISTSSFAQAYFNDSGRGWFWGETKPIVMQKKDENLTQHIEAKKNTIIIDDKEYKTIQKDVQIPFNELDKLHPDEISKLETESKNISVMYPTVENITEYKKLQKYITKKSVNFVDMNKVALTQSSELSNWSASIPRKRISLDVAREQKDIDMRKILNKHKEKMIVLVATEKNCPYCVKQLPILQMLTNQYGIKFKEIDIEEKRNFALKYQVQKTPDIFLLYNNNETPEIARVGTGLNALNEIVEGIGIALYTLKKESIEIIK